MSRGWYHETGVRLAAMPGRLRAFDLDPDVRHRLLDARQAFQHAKDKMRDGNLLWAYSLLLIAMHKRWDTYARTCVPRRTALLGYPGEHRHAEGEP